MNCVVTAGPTYEPIDGVRRLTNSSTGRLGSELADHLAACGHQVTLLRGETSTFRQTSPAVQVVEFSTTADLASRIESLAARPIAAVFHAAAVSDYRFGRVVNGAAETTARKLPTREGPLLVELVPTRKIIASLRTWFPGALLVGWKYELDGDRASALQKGRDQIRENRTDACVVNGAAYGAGFGLVRSSGDLHVQDADGLRQALGALLAR